MGATGVGKSHLAKQIFQLKKDKFQLSTVLLMLTVQPYVEIVPCRPYLVI